MTNINPNNLPKLRVVSQTANETLWWAVYDGQNQVTCFMNEKLARLLAASCDMMRLLASMSKRNNAPATVDITRMFKLHEINIDYDETR